MGNKEGRPDILRVWVGVGGRGCYLGDGRRGGDVLVAS